MTVWSYMHSEVTLYRKSLLYCHFFTMYSLMSVCSLYSIYYWKIYSYKRHLNSASLDICHLFPVPFIIVKWDLAFNREVESTPHLRNWQRVAYKPTKKKDTVTCRCSSVFTDYYIKMQLVIAVVKKRVKPAVLVSTLSIRYLAKIPCFCFDAKP